MDSDFQKKDSFLFLDFLILISLFSCTFDIYTLFQTESIDERIEELPEFLKSDQNINFLVEYNKYFSVTLFLTIVGTISILVGLYFMRLRKHIGLSLYVLGQLLTYLTLLLVMSHFILSSFWFILILG